MNKILNFLLTPLIAILLIIIKIPGKAPNTLLVDRLNHAPLIIYSLLIIGTIYNYFITVVSPYRALQKKKKKEWSDINEAAHELIQKYKDYELSFNIMVPQRKFFCYVEPDPKDFKKRRLTFFPKVFKVIWSYGDAHVHTKLVFTTKQGVIGEAYRDEAYAGYDLNELRKNGVKLCEKFNLNAEQKRLTEKIAMVTSCPILKTIQGADIQTTKVLGVVTVECTNPDGGIIVSNLTKRVAFYERLRELGKTYSYLTS